MPHRLMITETVMMKVIILSVNVLNAMASGANVIILLTIVLYCHFMVITMVAALFYNTE
jgi:hypothetical protein